MRKFRSKETGAILVPNSKLVIDQLSKSEYYEEIKEMGINDYSKSELIKYLTDLAIECNDSMKKSDLLALIPQE